MRLEHTHTTNCISIKCTKHCSKSTVKCSYKQRYNSYPLENSDQAAIGARIRRICTRYTANLFCGGKRCKSIDKHTFIDFPCIVFSRVCVCVTQKYVLRLWKMCELFASNFDYMIPYSHVIPTIFSVKNRIEHRSGYENLTETPLNIPLLKRGHIKFLNKSIFTQHYKHRNIWTFIRYLLSHCDCCTLYWLMPIIALVKLFECHRRRCTEH